MGSRLARRLSGLIVAASLCALAAPANAEWPQCLSGGRDDSCPDFYLNAVTDHGNVELSVGRLCAASWRHEWGRRDAHRAIVQSLDGAAEPASGGVCIPIDERVREVRVT